MVFDSSSNETAMLCLATNNRLLESKNAIKYLKELIDYKLSWEYHINHVVRQISIANEILSILRYYVPPSAFKKSIFQMKCNKTLLSK